jgi:hypothetical protein
MLGEAQGTVGKPVVRKAWVSVAAYGLGTLLDFGGEVRSYPFAVHGETEFPVKEYPPGLVQVFASMQPLPTPSIADALAESAATLQLGIVRL